MEIPVDRSIRSTERDNDSVRIDKLGANCIHHRAAHCFADQRVVRHVRQSSQVEVNRRRRDEVSYHCRNKRWHWDEVLKSELVLGNHHDLQ